MRAKETAVLLAQAFIREEGARAAVGALAEALRREAEHLRRTDTDTLAAALEKAAEALETVRGRELEGV